MASDESGKGKGGAPDEATTAPAALAPRAPEPSLGVGATITRSDPETPLAQTALLEEPLGRYERRCVLGEGGQSIVLRAWDNQLDREVAIKELRAGHRESAAARFLREAKVAARLEHPNIVPVYEIGRRADGTLYCVQKLVRADAADGQPRTLRRALQEAHSLDDRLRLLPHFVALCHGIAYAHAQGVLHRDVKPENVVLGRFGETVILDWGLAREASDSTRPDGQSGDQPLATVAGTAYGTPAYMSPEQARGETITLDAGTDVWSLGAMLFELLTGRLPFEGTSAADVVARVREAPVPDVLALQPDAPPELAAVARRALEKDRARRLGSAQQLADDVTAWQTGRRVSAYEYSAWELARLFVTRHKVVAVAALASVALLAGFGAFQSWQTERLNRAVARALVKEAEDADRALQWNRAAVLYAASRVRHDTPRAEWGARFASQRTVPPPLRLAGHGSGARSVAWSPDGERIATGSFDGTLRVFSPDGGLQWAVPGAHHNSVTSLSWAGDGRQLASAGEDGVVALWDTHARSRVANLTRPSKDPVNSVVLSQDGLYAVWGDELGRIVAADLDAGTLRFRQVSVAAAYSVALHPDQRRIAWSGWTGIAELLEPDSLVDAGVLPGPPPRAWVHDMPDAGVTVLANSGSRTLALSWSLGGQVLTASGADPALRVTRFAPRGNEPRVARAVGHQGKVNALVAGRGGLVFSGGSDRTVRAWNIAVAVPGLARSFGVDMEVFGVALSPDGSHVAVAGMQPDVEVHALGPPAEVAALNTRGEDFSAATARPLVAWGETAHHVVYDTERGVEVGSWKGLVPDHTDIALSRDGTLAARVCDYGRVCLEDLASPGAPTRTLDWSLTPMPDAPRANRVRAVAVAPGGAWVAASDGDRALRVWSGPGYTRTADLEALTRLAHTLDASHDGSLLAAGSYDWRVYVWNVAERRKLLELEGHTHGVRRVRFSRDGRTLASASWDGTVRLWDLATGRARCVLRGHVDHVFGVDFSPDDSFVVTGSRDATFRVWDARTCQSQAVVTADEPVFGLGLPGNGTAIFYAGASVHRVLIPQPRPARELLRNLEQQTGLTVEDTQVVPLGNR